MGRMSRNDIAKYDENAFGFWNRDGEKPNLLKSVLKNEVSDLHM